MLCFVFTVPGVACLIFDNVAFGYFEHIIIKYRWCIFMLIIEVFNTPYKLSTKLRACLRMRIFGCIKYVEIWCWNSMTSPLPAAVLSLWLQYLRWIDIKGYLAIRRLGLLLCFANERFTDSGELLYNKSNNPITIDTKNIDIPQLI